MKRSFTLISILLISHLIYAQWIQTKGPYAARTTAMITVGSNIYAANRDWGGTDGRIYRSSDFGQEWVAADNGIGEAYVLQFASIGETIVAATRNFYVYHTTDEGNNWNPSSNIFAPALSVEAIGNDFWCGTEGGGVFRSTDLGLTWQPMNTPILQNAGTVVIYDIASLNGNIFLATEGGGGPARLYRSSTNGASWEYANAGLPLGTNPIQFAVNGNTIFVSCEGDFSQYDYGLYKSEDNGNTWTECNNGIPEVVNGNTGEVWAHNGVVYVSTTLPNASPKIYKSINNGVGFTPAATGLRNENQVAEAYTALGGYVFTGMSRYASVFRSANQGDTWEEARKGLANATVFSLMEQNGRIYAGTQEGLFYTTDGGENWAEMQNGLPFGRPVTTMEKNGTYIFLGTDQYGVFRSPDNGNAWQQVNNGLAATFATNTNELLYFNNALYVATGDGVYKTIDNGNTWTVASTGLPTESGSIVTTNCLATHNSYLYVGTVLNGIYRSSDGGATWTSVNTGIPFAAFTIQDLLPAGSNLFAATDDGVFVSSNSGVSWQATSLNGGNVKRLYQANGILYASQYGPTVLTGYGIYKSLDNGATWTAFDDSMFPSARIQAFLLSGGNLYAGTDTRSVWKRTAMNSLPVTLTYFKGQKTVAGNHLTWATSMEQDSEGFVIERSTNGSHFLDIGFIRSNALNGHSSTLLQYSYIDKIATGAKNWYRLKQRSNSGKVDYSQIVLIHTDAKEDLSVKSVYPVPVKNSLTFSIVAKKTGVVVLTIVDASGRLLLQKTTNVSEGHQLVHLDVSMLAAGEYVVTANSTEVHESVSKQFIKD